ncbi:hypothetical protein [Acinetobacter soli]|uniref:hypothetical protein n=1 Tax=Acinetobacter soli TaxID=487316 RepID=UPI001C07F5EA|nr:hypothetical protein [Acinetobacter soli]
MIDLDMQREAFEDGYANHLVERDDSGFYINDGIQNSWEKHLLKAEIDSLKGRLEQAEKVWISTDFMLPDEDEAVLFLDKNNTIHDGYLSTDYVDGPYGENGEDFGDNQTLWSSNSNGEEFLPSEIKYWMPRPSSKSGSSTGEQS